MRRKDRKKVFDINDLPKLPESDPGEAAMPNYVKVYSILRDAVLEKGEEQALMPSENVMAKYWQVSRGTVRMAMDRLAEDGYIRKTQGRRAVVASYAGRQKMSFCRLYNCCVESAVTEVDGFRVKKEFQPCSDHVAAEMGLEKGGFLVLSVDVDYKSGGAYIAHSVTIFDAAYLEKFGIDVSSKDDIRDFVTDGIYKLASRSHGDFLISCSESTNQIPGLPAGVPVFVFGEVLRDENDHPLACCKYHMSGSHYRFFMERRSQ